MMTPTEARQRGFSLIKTRPIAYHPETTQTVHALTDLEVELVEALEEAHKILLQRVRAQGGDQVYGFAELYPDTDAIIRRTIAKARD